MSRISPPSPLTHTMLSRFAASGYARNAVSPCEPNDIEEITIGYEWRPTPGSTCSGSIGCRSDFRSRMWRIEIGCSCSRSRTLVEYSSNEEVPFAAAIAAL